MQTQITKPTPPGPSGPLSGRRVTDPRHETGWAAFPKPAQPQLPRPPSLGPGEAPERQGFSEPLRRVGGSEKGGPLRARALGVYPIICPKPIFPSFMVIISVFPEQIVL